MPSPAVRSTALSAAALTSTFLPLYLLGAVADLVGEDLGLDDAAVGGAIAFLWVATVLGASTMGRVSDRVGARRALRTGVALGATALATIAWAADRWWHLAAAMMVTGFGIALIDTGAARAFTAGVAADRRGRATGIKESAAPTASLLAGVGIPTLASTYGWRALFVAGLPVCALVWLGLRGLPSDGPAGRAPSTGARMGAPIRWLAVGAGLGGGAATAGATFLVPALRDRDLSDTAAGATLALASICAIGMRLLMGYRADRPGSHPVATIAALLGAGTVGAAVLATDAPPALAIPGAVVLLTFGWGWVGLLFLAAMRIRPDAPAAATGVVLSGLGAGGLAGPWAFGAITSAQGRPTAWLAVTIALAAGSVLVASTRRYLHVAAAPSGRQPASSGG